MPVQRIPRYILLLQDYKSNTEESHPDYQNLGKALETLKNIADRINEEKRNQERRMRMVQLNSTLTHSEALGKLIVPGRLLLKEGPVVFHKSVNKVSKSGYLFLFNDLLMYTRKSKEKFDMQHNLNLVDKHFEVKAIPDSEGKNDTLQTLYSDVTNAMYIRNETVNMTISLDNAKERDQWISEIHEALSSLQSKMNRLSL